MMTSDGKASSPKLVRDLMSVGVLTCSLNTSVRELAQVLLERDLEGAVVLDDQGHAAGIISWNELVSAYTSSDSRTLTAEEIMRVDVPQVPPDIPLIAAAQIMQDKGIRILFLMHHAGGIEYPAAMLTYKHLLRHLAMENPDDLADLGIKAVRESPLETFYKRRDDARRRAGEGGT
jgi:predicted transcriptional regulator